MNLVVRVGFLICVLSLVAFFLRGFAGLSFGTTDFFVNHGFIFLVSIAFFPRVTLLVSGLFFNSIAFGGFFWWLGFFFAPRVLVACLATISYWQTNPFLVVASWLIALGGESSEKLVIRRSFSNRRAAPRDVSPTYDIEVEAKRIE